MEYSPLWEFGVSFFDWKGGTSIWKGGLKSISAARL